jgi:hypothetical protein
VLQGQLPRDASKTAAERAWYFASDTGKATLGTLTPSGTILSLNTWRDLAALWQAREELFDERIVAGFTQADTQLGLFFSSRDFGPEVLGELQPAAQFIVARQQFAPQQPVPSLKLPAMALVVGMKHPDQFATELLVAYQKIVGITNIAGGQQGQPSLLLSSEQFEGVTISKAEYLQKEFAAGDKVPINYNFSPSCARVGDTFVFGSTADIVRHVIVELKKTPTSPPTAENTRIAIDTTTLSAILDDNRELLISQNMLNEGHDRDQAEQAIEAVFALLRVVTGGELRLVSRPDSLVLEAAVEISESAATE